MYINLVDKDAIRMYHLVLQSKTGDGFTLNIKCRGKSPWDAVDRYAKSLGHQLSWYKEDYNIIETTII